MATKTNKEKAEAGDQARASAIIFLDDVAIATQGSGTIIQRVSNANLPNRCFRSRVIEVSGVAQTQANGQVRFRLTSFLCPAGEKFSFPINVVATPIAEKPFYLTVKHQLMPNGEDVEITVFSWDALGGPAPDVRFNWRCRVERV